MSFQPSINIVHDVGNNALFKQYVPNNKQIEIMNEVLENVLLGNQRAHLLVGPYGAGKSLISAMTTTLLTQKKITKEVKQFLKDVYTVSPNLEEKLQRNLSQRNLKWIPITITGKTGDFETILLESIQKQCNLNNIILNLKHDATYIIDLIRMWKAQYSDVYKTLGQVLSQMDLTIDLLIDKLKNGETDAVSIFKNIYSQVVAGTVFYNPNKIDFIEQLSFIFEQLLKKKIGIFIVFDEFGRFLQTITSSKIALTMQQIQDLSELVNRISNAGLLMITHTGLQQYSNSNINLTQEELERVEKRFMEHRLESDSSIFYRSAYKLLPKVKKNSANVFLASDYDTLSYGIMKYNLFPGMSNDEIEGTIIEGCQPIHPLTIQLIPGLSNILGQNDRTLYMFLNQFDMEAEQSQWYYADRLFDYFYPDESMLLTLDSMRYYRLALNYKVSEEALRLIKLGTLLKILNNRFLIREDFLQFALGLEESEVLRVLKELQEVKLIRYNPLNNAYELYEGSIAALDNLYNEVSKSFAITNTMREEALDEIHETKYYLSLGYNTEKSMTRYIERFFFIGEPSISIPQYCDGVIAYIIPQDISEKKKIEKKVEACSNDDILFGFTSINLNEIGAIIDEYLILNQILNSADIINEDNNLKREIKLKIETVVYKIHHYLQSITSFKDKKVEYHLAGKPVKIHSIEKFEQFIDDWMFKKFHLSPEVRNENFNKTNVMPIQKKSSIMILDQILKPDFNGDFDIKGTGPDYLIYATTFKNLNFNFKDLDNQPTKELALLRKELIRYLDNNNRSSIMELFNIALKKPFGIRKPLVPLFIVALLRDKWNQMAFYAKDFIISAMTGTILYEIIEQDVLFYEYEIYQLSQDEQNMLKVLNSSFFNNKLTLNLNYLFKKLNHWLLELPRFTQVTEIQSEKILTFKSLIRASETDPLMSIKKLVNMKLSKSDVLKIKEELENFLINFKDKLNYDTLNIFNVNHIKDIKSKHEEVIIKSPKLQDIISIYSNSNDIESLVLKVVGIRLEEWSDVTYDSYLATLKQNLIETDSQGIQLFDGEKVLTTIKQVELSVKGRTIHAQLQRIVDAGGRTMNPEEVKYILYKILTSI